MNQLQTRKEVLTDVPSNQLDQILKDFKDSGAQVNVISQKDGLYQIEAVFVTPAPPTLSSPASGSFSTTR